MNSFWQWLTNSETGKRILVAMVMLAVLWILLFLPYVVFLFIAFLLSCVGIKEMWQVRKTYNPVYSLLMTAMTPLFLFSFFCFIDAETGTLDCPLHLVPLKDTHGFRMILSIGIIVFGCADTMAYFGGRTLGKYFPAKLSPHSPNKTIVGLVSALGGSAVVGYFVLPHIIGCHPIFGLFSGVILCGISSKSDLVYSRIKREAGIKDFGTIFGPHGGFYDRFDGFVGTVRVTSILYSLTIWHATYS